MIRHLSIRQFITAEAVDLDLAGGFTALTGETGAGKSLLINALGLLLGGRADATMVRQGAARADLSVEFEIPEGLRDALQTELAESGLEAGDDAHDSLLLRRSVEATGRSRAWVNGQTATLQQLRSIGEQLVNIHGQHEHQRLMQPSQQQALLDRHAGLESTLSDFRRAYDQWRQVQDQLIEAQDRQASIASELAELQARRDLLETLQPAEGEWEQLDQEHRSLSHGAELLETSQACLAALSESDEPLIGAVSRLQHRLTGLLDRDPRLQPSLDCLAGALIQLEEAEAELSRYVGRIDLDPERLAELETRISLYHDTARRLRCRPDDLMGEWLRVREQLDLLGEQADLGLLQRREAEAAQRAQASAAVLTTARQKAALDFGEAVSRWLHELAMPGSRFRVHLEPRSSLSRNGAEEVQFRLCHGGHPEGTPLAKTASGGELSRVSLAIAAVAAHATDVPTLLFDEVDAGIGGNTGHVIGRLLRDLGATHQVLVVTHLPQVAARARHHLQVAKSEVEGLPSSRVTPLQEQDRVDELARMLGDEGLKDSTRAVARELLTR